MGTRFFLKTGGDMSAGQLKISCPSYLHLYESGEVDRRVEQGLASLENCQVCPWNCGINRLQDEKRICRTRRYARAAFHWAYSAEDDCFRGCNRAGSASR